MAYLKTTVIGGKTQSGEYKNVAMRGHWNPDSAYRYAKKRGWTSITLWHSTADMSGLGRGSDDARFEITDEGVATKIHGLIECDDSLEIAALYDAQEAID